MPAVTQSHDKNLADVDDYILPPEMTAKWAFLFKHRKGTTREEWLAVSKKFLLGVDYLRLAVELAEITAHRDLINSAIVLKQIDARPKLKRINSLDESDKE